VMALGDQDLIDRLRAAGEQTLTTTPVPAGLAHRARAAGRRRRTVRSLTAASLAASAALATGVLLSGWGLPLPGGERSTAPASTRTDPVVDGVRIGHLPSGYVLSEPPRTEESDGEWLTRAVFNPGGKPAGQHRRSIVISVWRVAQGDQRSLPECPG